jgi:hypothetical protein
LPTPFIGAKEKPLAARRSTGVSFREAIAISIRITSRNKFSNCSSLLPIARAIPGRQVAAIRMAATIPATELG